MHIVVLCPYCSRSFRLPEECVGREAKCKCGRAFFVAEAYRPRQQASNTDSAPASMCASEGADASRANAIAVQQAPKVGSPPTDMFASMKYEPSGKMCSPLLLVLATIAGAVFGPILVFWSTAFGGSLGSAVSLLWGTLANMSCVAQSTAFGVSFFFGWFSTIFFAMAFSFPVPRVTQWCGNRNIKAGALAGLVIGLSSALVLIAAPAAFPASAKWDRSAAGWVEQAENFYGGGIASLITDLGGVARPNIDSLRPWNWIGIRILFLGAIVGGMAGGYGGASDPYCEKCGSYPKLVRKLRWYGIAFGEFRQLATSRRPSQLREYRNRPKPDPGLPVPTITARFCRCTCHALSIVKLRVRSGKHRVESEVPDELYVDGLVGSNVQRQAGDLVLNPESVAMWCEVMEIKEQGNGIASRS